MSLTDAAPQQVTRDTVLFFRNNVCIFSQHNNATRNSESVGITLIHPKSSNAA